MTLSLREKRELLEEYSRAAPQEALGATSDANSPAPFCGDKAFGDDKVKSFFVRLEEDGSEKRPKSKEQHLSAVRRRAKRRSLPQRSESMHLPQRPKSASIEHQDSMMQELHSRSKSQEALDKHREERDSAVMRKKRAQTKLKQQRPRSAQY